MHEQYQHIRGVSDRYAAMKPVLRRFTRPFSLLDIGANAGAFSLATRIDFPNCHPVLIEKEDIPSGLPRIHARVAADDLLELGISEHFDVVLLLSVLHHIEDWREFLRGVFSLGTHVIIEYPMPSDTEARHQDRMLEQYEVLSKSMQTPLGIFPGYNNSGERQLSLFHWPKPFIHTGSFYGKMKREVPHKKKAHEVLDGYNLKFVQDRPFIPGINLWSFLHLGGAYPPRHMLADRLPFPDRFHGDIRPWNYILNCDGLHLIDYGGKDYHPNDRVAYEETRNWILNGGGIS